MRRFIAFCSILALTSGCASMAIPRMPNLRSYEPATCEPVLQIHVPQRTANIHEYGLIVHDLKENASLLDKLVSTGQVEALGKSGIQLGSGLGLAVSAFKDNMSLGNFIASAALGVVTAVTDARSEDKTQDRVDVCMPKDHDLLFFKNEDAVLVAMKKIPENMTNLDFLKYLDRSPRTGGVAVPVDNSGDVSKSSEVAISAASKPTEPLVVSKPSETEAREASPTGPGVIAGGSMELAGETSKPSN